MFPYIITDYSIITHSISMANNTISHPTHILTYLRNCISQLHFYLHILGNLKWIIVKTRNKYSTIRKRCWWITFCNCVDHHFAKRDVFLCYPTPGYNDNNKMRIFLIFSLSVLYYPHSGWAGATLLMNCWQIVTNYIIFASNTPGARGETGIIAKWHSKLSKVLSIVLLYSLWFLWKTVYKQTVYNMNKCKQIKSSVAVSRCKCILFRCIN